jgi:signal transduction histidine kinase
MTDPQRAQVLLRCAQEIITNSVRHAQASNLWIRLSATPEGLAMSARDDGCGVSSVHHGNGLTGMTERLVQLGGKLEIESSRGAGFALHAWLPMEGLS